MKPVYRTDIEKDWKPIPGTLDYVEFDDVLKISFKFNFQSKVKNY